MRNEPQRINHAIEHAVTCGRLERAAFCEICHTTFEERRAAPPPDLLRPAESILSGTFDPDTLPSTRDWPSSWAFRVRLSWKLMTSCWPKVLSSAAAVQEHTSPRFCPPTGWLCPGRRQRCSYRASGRPLQLRRQLSMDRSRHLGIAMISSLAGARVTSKLFLSSTGRTLTRRARKASVAELD
jgi:hypothetical protein